MTADFGASVRRFAVYAALALALFALLEITARVWLFGLAGLDPRRVDSVHSIGRSGFLKPSTTPGLSYELRPNLDGWLKLARLRTNAEGLRDREIPLAKPPGEFRIAVIGDSYAMPSGVALADSFHGQLEARFAARSPSRAVEFVNFGVAGYLPHEFLAALRRKALDYDPDLILVVATARSAGGFTARAPVGGFVYRSREVSHPFFESFLWKVARRQSGSQHDAGPRRGPRPSIAESKGVILENVVERIARLSREKHIPTAIVRLETNDRPESEKDQKLRRQSEENGLAFVDTRSAFAGTNDRDFWIHPLDRHPNGSAHTRFADVIERFLDAEGWLDPGPPGALAEGAPSPAP